MVNACVWGFLVTDVVIENSKGTRESIILYEDVSP